MFFARFIQFSFTACRSWTCPEDTEEGKSKLRSSAMKELVWLLAIVIPSVWSDDGFLTEPRKCQVDCAALISKLQTVEDALQSVCQMI